MLLGVGAVPVLAHPGEDGIKRDDIEQLVKKGLKGIEVFSLKHDSTKVQYYQGVSEDLQILGTAGTDFHDRHQKKGKAIAKRLNGKPLKQGVDIDQILLVR